jgi:replication-associated recombination protein RarA
MRPQSLDDFVGQEQILGEQSALRLAIAEDRVGSSILYGPPGSGKTTLARVIANTTGAYFEELSAVSATVSQVREVIAGRRGAARRARAADDPLPRRDPPLQQGAAGRAPARRSRRGS